MSDDSDQRCAAAIIQGAQLTKQDTRRTRTPSRTQARPGRAPAPGPGGCPPVMSRPGMAHPPRPRQPGFGPSGRAGPPALGSRKGAARWLSGRVAGSDAGPAEKRLTEEKRDPSAAAERTRRPVAGDPPLLRGLRRLPSVLASSGCDGRGMPAPSRRLEEASADSDSDSGSWT